MRTRKAVGSVLFFIGLIALWQLLYIAATDWFAWAKPYAVPHPAGVVKSVKTLLVNGTLFAALPSSVAGMKQAWSFAWRALMSGEVMSASVGLGYTLMMGRDLADINQVMTVMLRRFPRCS